MRFLAVSMSERTTHRDAQITSMYFALICLKILSVKEFMCNNTHNTAWPLREIVYCCTLSLSLCWQRTPFYLPLSLQGPLFRDKATLGSSLEAASERGAKSAAASLSNGQHRLQKQQLHQRRQGSHNYQEVQLLLGSRERAKVCVFVVSCLSPPPTQTCFGTISNAGLRV